MKKLFVSTGLAAVGIASLQSAYGQGLDLVSPKAWSISGSLRGFYDDNYNISNTKKGSWGLEANPSVSLNVPLQQTDMGIRYNYGLYYYNDRDTLGLDPFDQSHQVDIWLDHAINERWKINFTDTFTYGRDPSLQGPPTQGGGPESGVLYRVQGDNLANHANISLDTQWTKLFGTSLHYGNDFYDYENSGAGVTAPTLALVPPGSYLFPIDPGQFGARSLTGAGASLAGLLDRVEQNIGLDFTLTLSPETMLLAGYTFSWANYTGNEPVAVFNYASQADPLFVHSYVYNSSSRDGASQEAHVGIQHQLTGNIMLMAQVGVQYSDNSNDPFQSSESVSPTANVSISYTYTPGSYLELGVTQAHNATDVVAPGANGSISQYQDTTGVFGSWNQKITDKLSSSLVGQYTYSTYEGGAASSISDQGVDVSLNLTYQISRHFSADAGYNFDDLISGIDGRGYSRNRVYMGMSASY